MAGLNLLQTLLLVAVLAALAFTAAAAPDGGVAGDAALGRLGALLAHIAAPNASSAAGSASADAGGFTAANTAAQAAPRRPNILFILVDDLDKQMDTLSHMPRINALLAGQGTTFDSQFVTTSLCCPTRASIFSGMFAHNNNFTDVAPPGGGWERYFALGLANRATNVHLAKAGYETYFLGKYVNGYSLRNYDLVPEGWTVYDGLVIPWQYQLFNPTISRNGQPPKRYPRYQTDLLAERAAGLLEDHASHHPDKPFFMYLAPTAPHTESWFNPSGKTFKETVRTTVCRPHPRHAELFKDLRVPRTPNFNPAEPTGKLGWMANLPRLTEEKIAVLDEWYRQRARCMMAVDEMVGSLVDTLEKLGKLENTYIFFTSDNGFHLGHHRMGAGKMTGIEEDIRVPLIVRGPGVRKNHVSHDFGSHTDVAATILDLAGVPLPEDYDGRPIDVHGTGKERGETLAVEYWAMALDEESNVIEYNASFKAIRLLSTSHSYYYAVHCLGGRELYDLRADPFQLRNIHGQPGTGRVVARLDALLKRMRTCRGSGCREPWEALHPGGGVRRLADALDPKFDEQYAGEVPYAFGRCSASAYDAEGEGVPVVRVPSLEKLQEEVKRSRAWVAGEGARNAARYREMGGPTDWLGFAAARTWLLMQATYGWFVGAYMFAPTI
ncbi:alkaline-phosphatase-like protein [Hyaloraphidium curvatum]|nr:alkaline-phosphatase-like protein [Hyaloraphidium curvatum]